MIQNVNVKRSGRYVCVRFKVVSRDGISVNRYIRLADILAVYPNIGYCIGSDIG